jgi:flagella basal body P-ring formation protein FlgA
MRRPLVFLSYCFFALALQALWASEGVMVRLPEKAAVVGPEISLGEIAEIITGDNAKADRLRRLTLGRAAPAGGQAKMTLGYIKIALRREGYSLADFAFAGAETVQVLTQSQSFDPSGLAPRVKAFVVDQTGESPENVDVKMEGAGKAILLPAGEISAHFRPSLTGSYEGTVFLTADLEVDGRLVRVLPVRATVEIYRPAVTAVRKVDKGEKFSPDNVALVRTPSSKVTKGCFRKLDYVVGRTASIPLAAGTVLRVNDLYDPPVIQRWQLVQGIVDRGNLELSVEVRALEDGKAGDAIRVENTESHTLIRGKVLDEKTVLIIGEGQ